MNVSFAAELPASSKKAGDGRKSLPVESTGIRPEIKS
jgi:hypothetical protein